MGTNYERGLFRQNQELTKRCELLEYENRALRAENTYLRQELNSLKDTLEERIEKAVRKAVAEATEPLLAQIEEQKGIIQRQATEIERLKSQIGKNSSNSSKPPSSNGYKRVLNTREKSERKQGGQQGHKGSNLCIPSLDELSRLVDKGKAEYVILSSVNDGEEYISDWQIDIKTTTVYTEIRRPIGAPPKVEYGENITVQAAYLATVGLMSVKRVSEYLRTLTDGLVTISKSTIQAMINRVAEKIDMEPLTNDLLNGVVMKVDETPIKTSERVNVDGTVETSQNTTMNAYIRTYSNAETTVLTANAHKDIESVEKDDILPQFVGIVIQDFESKFLRYGTATGLCGAHLSRELKGLYELEKVQWAKEFRDFINEMNERKNADMQKVLSVCDAILLLCYEARYDELVKQGEEYLLRLNAKSYAFKVLKPLIKRLKEHKNEYLLFMRDYRVPFTNNLAERDLRHGKTRQKISGCFRSWQGFEDYCKLRSLIGTSIKRGQNVFEKLRAILNKPVCV